MPRRTPTTDERAHALDLEVRRIKRWYRGMADRTGNTKTRDAIYRRGGLWEARALLSHEAMREWLSTASREDRRDEEAVEEARLLGEDYEHLLELLEGYKRLGRKPPTELASDELPSVPSSPYTKPGRPPERRPWAEKIPEAVRTVGEDPGHVAAYLRQLGHRFNRRTLDRFLEELAAARLRLLPEATVEFEMLRLDAKRRTTSFDPVLDDLADPFAKRLEARIRNLADPLVPNKLDLPSHFQADVIEAAVRLTLAKLTR